MLSNVWQFYSMLLIYPDDLHSNCTTCLMMCWYHVVTLTFNFELPVYTYKSSALCIYNVMVGSGANILGQVSPDQRVNNDGVWNYICDFALQQWVFMQLTSNINHLNSLVRNFQTKRYQFACSDTGMDAQNMNHLVTITIKGMPNTNVANIATHAYAISEMGRQTRRAHST